MALICKLSRNPACLRPNVYLNKDSCLVMCSHLRLTAKQSPFKIRNFSAKSSVEAENDDVDNKPIRFSSSEAAKWKAEYSRTGSSTDHEVPDEQSTVVVFSLAIFLIYFLALREENDIDIRIRGGAAPNIMSNVEEVQLKLIVMNDAKTGRYTNPQIFARLRELDEMKLKVAPGN